MSSEDTELITLAEASRLTGVPLEAIKKAVKAKTSFKRMWSTTKQTPFGPVRYTTREAAEEYRKAYRPHIKKS